MNRPDPPYEQLAESRAVPPWLPADLGAFYRTHEGVGREASDDHPVRLCRLDQLAVVGIRDLHLFDEEPLDGGWDEFSAVRVGIGCFFDELVYVLRSPVCPAGSVMAFGVDVNGPGGDGADPHPGSFVLAASFADWIDRLRADQWDEFGLAPGEMDRLSPGRAAALRRYFRHLNPLADWTAES